MITFLMQQEPPTECISAKKPRTQRSGRLHLLDTLRGLAVLSMIAYHAAWDCKYMLGLPMPWYTNSLGVFSYARLWQQATCWTFIFLSGLCYPLSRSHLKRGLTVFGAGVLVMLVTHLFMPGEAITFGVLTLHGSAMLLFIIVSALWQKRGRTALSSLAAALFCLALFVLTRDLSSGSLGFERLFSLPLPEELYRCGLFGAYIGFTPADFSSSDYFPLLPWVFLFGVGYFLSPLIINREQPARILRFNIPPLSFIGRHALLIYLLHQPILALICTVIGQL